jgi:hypothetical protein
MALDTQVAGNIKQAANADGGVDHDTPYAVTGVLSAQLNGVVHHGPYIRQIAKKVSHALAQPAGGGVPINSSHRLYDSAIERIIESKDTPVK